MDETCDPSAQEVPYQNNVEVFTEQTDETGPSERMSLSALKRALQRQLEYYFSRENLSTDEYLISQMDGENYVSISTVAKFNQVRRLTDDHGLVVEVLRESALVQVDEAGEKVRPSPRSGVLILREIPESTPTKELEELFSGEECPKFLRCEYANNNTWYVLFESDEDTQRAYGYLREAAVTFHGKPVRARIKSKAVTSAPFTSSYKNNGGTQDGVGAPPQVPPPSAVLPAEYSTQPTAQQQQPPPLQYTYSAETSPYTNQQVCPPFYPPTMLQAWAPTTPAVDLGTVLSVNGLSPQAAYRPLNSNTNRHNFTSNESQRYRTSSSQQSYVQQRSQQLHPHQSFPNLVNTFDYMPAAAYSTRAASSSSSSSRHNSAAAAASFGMDMNFFTAPNLYYNKVPMYNRHNPVLVPQQQNYGSAYAKETKEVKENWAPNQRQRGKRWWKENGSVGSSRSSSETTSHAFVKSSESKSESPKFDLETTSFPPLPGCMESDIIDVDVYESRLSDIVKGTVKVVKPESATEERAPSATEETATPTQPVLPTSPPSETNVSQPDPEPTSEVDSNKPPLFTPSISTPDATPLSATVTNGSPAEEQTQVPTTQAAAADVPAVVDPGNKVASRRGGGGALDKRGKRGGLNQKSALVVVEEVKTEVNGHTDSDAAVSSEDEKHQLCVRKLTYSEVAMRAKEKVEKIAQEQKDKERPPQQQSGGARAAQRNPASKEWRKPPLST